MKEGTHTMPQSNVDTYVSRLKPLRSREEFEAMADDFFADLYALQKKHGIPDLAFAYQVVVEGEAKDGGVGLVQQNGIIGDPANQDGLLIIALAQLAKTLQAPSRQQLIADIGAAIERAGVVSTRELMARKFKALEPADGGT